MTQGCMPPRRPAEGVSIVSGQVTSSTSTATILTTDDGGTVCAGKSTATRGHAVVVNGRAVLAGGAPEIYIGETAPAVDSTYLLWVDTSV